MNIIVFSKDRAMQLELFIRSFNKYVKNFDKYVINIIYTYSNDNFKLGYDKLKNMNYLNVNYLKETNFKQDIIQLFNSENKYSVFFVDDDIFKYPFDFYDNQMDIFEKNSDILCRSLRLHPNLTYCYTMKMGMVRPNFLHNNIFVWKGQSADFGYPMSVDGHIFKTKDILPLILNLNYTNPNSFESIMANNTLNLPKMICYDKSIVVNNPCNKVQNYNNNHHGTVKSDYLNNKFLEGYIISMNNIDGLENISCHQEIEIILEKNENIC
jgi:hypothetical protein